MRDKVVDLVIGQISLFLACFDQLFNVVVLVIKSLNRFSSDVRSGRTPNYSAVGSWYGVVQRHKLWKYSTQRAAFGYAT